MCDEINGVARTFREKQLPCDALIYLGTEFTPSGWNTRNGEFTWHAGNFPEPRKTIDALHAQHFKIVLHIVFEGRRLASTLPLSDALLQAAARDGSVAARLATTSPHSCSRVHPTPMRQPPSPQ